MTLDSTQPHTKQLIRNLFLRNTSQEFLEWQQAVVYHTSAPRTLLKDPPLLSFRTQRPYPVLNRSPILHSEPPSHSVIPNSPILPFRAAPFCHSEQPPSVILNAAPSPPVILNVAQRSEESKIIAHTPFTDFSNCVELGLDYQWVLGLMERWASQDARSLSIALSMISNFRIHATSATLPHFPAALSRS